MKTDNYLTLCLEQAAKSPLHYRHGCIIVRGGKVIGQGHNDYRPGFDGGVLKHGRVANSALNGPALADMKAKLKQRKENKSKQKDEQQQQDSDDFVAFEKVGGGRGTQAYTPLSMHSEMMAIHSALSTSSTLACGTSTREKPCMKLPRGDKKKERLRRDVLKTYVERICDNLDDTTSSAAHGQGGKLQVQQRSSANATPQRRGGTRPQLQQQRPPCAGPGGAAAGGRGQGVSRSQESCETSHSECEEEREASQGRSVRLSTSSSRPVWETDKARFFAATQATALCI